MLRRAPLAWIVAAAVACGGQTNPTPEPVSPQPAPQAAAQPDEGKRAPAPAVADDLPAIPDTPQPAPDSLLALLEVASPSDTWRDLAQYLDVVSPGIGKEFSPDLLATGISDMLELTRSDAVALDKPMRLLLLDPQQVSDPAVAVIYAADPKALRDAARQGGRAVIEHNGVFAVGSRLALTEGAAHALTTVASAPAPTAPRVTIHVRRIMERYRAQIEMMAGMIRAQAAQVPQGGLATTALDGLLAVTSQVEVATVTAAFDVVNGTGTLALTPIDGTGLATFIAAQRPAPLALAASLPDGPIVFGIQLDMATIRDAFAEMVKTMTEAVVGGDLASRYQQSWDLLELFDGEMAGTATFDAKKGYGMSMLAAVSDPKAYIKASEAEFKKMAKAAKKDKKLVYTYRRNALRHRGVALNLVSMALGPNATDVERMMLATFGGKQDTYTGNFKRMILTTWGSNARASARALIDRVRGKPAVAGWLDPVLADARDRKESALVAVDLAQISTVQSGKPAASSGPGVALGVGFGGGAMTWRVTVPAQQAAVVAKINAPAPALIPLP